LLNIHFCSPCYSVRQTANSFGQISKTYFDLIKIGSTFQSNWGKVTYM
jgi:hypothetical protein